MKYFEQGPELYYLLGGALSAFVMAVMRSFQYTRKQFALRLVEAFMCSMLTASFAVSLHVVWNLSYVWAIPAGTVIGFLGTDMIHGIIVSMLEAYANRQAGGYGGRIQFGNARDGPDNEAPFEPRPRTRASHTVRRPSGIQPDDPDGN